jgi:hypothetical protein
MKDGVPQRFCQQCGRFHLLSEFDGNKRSCRARWFIASFDVVLAINLILMHIVKLGKHYDLFDLNVWQQNPCSACSPWVLQYLWLPDISCWCIRLQRHNARRRKRLEVDMNEDEEGGGSGESVIWACLLEVTGLQISWSVMRSLEPLWADGIQYHDVSSIYQSAIAAAFIHSVEIVF